MSVVAVKVYDDKIVMGADNQYTYMYGDKIINNKDRPVKLFDLGNIVFGGAGSLKDIIAMKQYLHENEPKGLDNVDSYYRFFAAFYKRAEDKSLGLDRSDSEFLFVANDKVFFVGDFYVEEIHDFSAIGSGGPKAMIGLYLGHDISESLKAACHYDLYCHEPIIIHEIKKSKKK